MLKELLIKHLGDESKASAFMDEMKQSKIYTASEENLDKRYSKLKNDFDSKTKEHQEALTLIEQLKNSSAGNEALQSQITQYESTIKQLKAQNLEMQKENAIKMALLAGKAKADDVDYLMYRMKNDSATVKVNDKGEITNMSDILEGLKKSYPSHFEADSKKEVVKKDLPDHEDDKNTITREQFNKMGYRQRLELNNSNPELYNELSSKKD